MTPCPHHEQTHRMLADRLGHVHDGDQIAHDVLAQIALACPGCVSEAKP